MHMETIWKILKDAQMEDGRSADILTVEVYNAVLPHLQNGIHNEEEELAFCGEIKLILDEGGVSTTVARTEAMCQIYDAAGFEHYWQA